MQLRVQYGGTFDPVHNGHLAVATAARDALDADIWLMPAHDPPHKGPTSATARQRACMLELAVQDQPRLQLDDRELRRDGPSWTIDTLRELRGELDPQAPLAILIGADSFLQLPTWRDWQALTGFAHIVIAERPGHPIPVDALPAPLQVFAAGRWLCDAPSLQANPAGGLYRLALPLRPESATAIRHRIADGRPWQQDVPTAVAEYIVRHGLYRSRHAEAASL